MKCGADSCSVHPAPVRSARCRCSPWAGWGAPCGAVLQSKAGGNPTHLCPGCLCWSPCRLELQMIWRPASVREQQISSCAESPGGLPPAGSQASMNTTHALDRALKRGRPLPLGPSCHPLREPEATPRRASCSCAVQSIPCKHNSRLCWVIAPGWRLGEVRDGGTRGWHLNSRRRQILHWRQAHPCGHCTQPSWSIVATCRHAPQDTQHTASPSFLEEGRHPEIYDNTTQSALMDISTFPCPHSQELCLVLCTHGMLCARAQDGAKKKVRVRSALPRQPDTSCNFSCSEQNCTKDSAQAPHSFLAQICVGGTAEQSPGLWRKPPKFAFGASLSSPYTPELSCANQAFPTDLTPVQPWFCGHFVTFVLPSLGRD